ncbi:hypothetical protein Rsub_09521 [Raphidocelis subcapitata]|uniref:Farnesoic acid O-methyl transferase domain-containing protein n=1 Tax=Raphidocelis subcapitata TaxID=307507 RepID=A0A2V0PB13_9CHLO|nr:hypothetical protein Rsub_09521 [Raphidocelis subcapitata]|eukprot:GBF97048.1 hypothetical protein Rsub_09521 [Raphidocelis subcapitata]
MLRVNSRDVLVVPPFECAWLSLSDYGVEGQGCCLSFDCRGDNDVTIIFKAVAGAKRWQPLARPLGGGGAPSVEDNYTVILGSHRNSCLKFEKNGETAEQVQGVAGARVGAREFSPFWINCADGAITVGAGAPGEGVAHRWVDPAPGELARGVRHAGLSCWDRHVSYRNVRVLPPLDAAALAAAAAAAARRRLEAGAAASAGGEADAAGGGGGVAEESEVPSCFELASAVVVASLSPRYACAALQVAELLLPASQRVHEVVVEWVGRRFQECAERALGELSLLPAAALADILCQPLMSVREFLIFEVVAAWACYGQPPQSPAAAAAAAAAGAGAARAFGCGGGARQSGSGDSCSTGDGVGAGRAEADGALRGAGSSSGSDDGGGGGKGAAPSKAAARDSCANGGSAHAQACEPAPGGGAAGPSPPGGSAADGAYRPAAELAQVVPLIRFMLMSHGDLESVRAHPFVERNPLVAAEMRRQLDAAAAGAAAGAAGYVFDRRRLVRPAAAAGAAAAAPAVPEPVAAPAGGCGGARPPAAGPAQSPASAPAPAPAQPPPLFSPAPPPQQRFARRLAPSCRELMYVYDGDGNGAVAHIATDYGARGWVNPVLTRRVEVRASSPASRFTDPKAIVGGTFPRTSFACPRMEGGQPCTWWLVDLGPPHRLLCNYYTMRHDGSSDFPRHWVLQASNDLQHWVDLRRHISDASIRLPGQYASWPVSGPASQLPFRAFRLLLTGPTLSATTPWNFCLSFVELYGYFYRDSGE